MVDREDRGNRRSMDGNSWTDVWGKSVSADADKGMECR